METAEIKAINSDVTFSQNTIFIMLKAGLCHAQNKHMVLLSKHKPQQNPILTEYIEHTLKSMYNNTF